jgi:hypothetical protein
MHGASIRHFAIAQRLLSGYSAKTVLVSINASRKNSERNIPTPAEKRASSHRIGIFWGEQQCQRASDDSHKRIFPILQDAFLMTASHPAPILRRGARVFADPPTANC